MHSAAEELSTGPRLTTVMKPIPVGGEGGRERGEVEGRWGCGDVVLTGVSRNYGKNGFRKSKH